MFECDELSPSVYCSAVLKSQPEGRRGRYSQLMWFTLETCESIADLVCYFLSSVVQDSANQPVLLLAGLSILTHTVHSHTHTRTHTPHYCQPSLCFIRQLKKGKICNVSLKSSVPAALLSLSCAGFATITKCSWQVHRRCLIETLQEKSFRPREGLL